MTASRRLRAAESVAVAVACAHNWAAHRRLPRRAYIPVNLGVAASLVALARWAGVSWDELGLNADAAAAGVKTGVAGGAVIAGLVAAAAAMPGSASLFEDQEVRSHPRRAAMFETAVRIPLGTAVAEELAFRSALLGLSSRMRGWRRSVAWTSALFGLWHILPAIDKGPLFTDDVATDAVEIFPHRAVWSSVVVTAGAGVALANLRRRSGSVIAPVIAHAVANITAFVLTRRR